MDRQIQRYIKNRYTEIQIEGQVAEYKLDSTLLSIIHKSIVK